MKKSYSGYLGLFLAVFVSILIFIFQDKFVDLEGYGLLGIFLLSVIGNATIVLPMPVVLTAFIAGSIYNPLIVSLIVAFGASIGELTGYIAGLSGQKTVEKSEKIKKVKIWMDKYGLWTIFVLAAIPNPLFDIAGIIAGAYKISVYKYFIVVFFGKLIKFSLIAVLGGAILN